jgi:hypothetical protein
MTKEKFTFRPHKRYEVTCTFTDNYQFIKETQLIKSQILDDLEFGVETYSPVKRLEMFCRFVETQYKLLWNCQFTFNLEISDPQKIGPSYPRLHLHGWVKWDNEYDILKWKLSNAPTLIKFGNVQFNQYRPKEWLTYMNKDQKHLKKAISYVDVKYLNDVKFTFTDSKNAPGFFDSN